MQQNTAQKGPKKVHVFPNIVSSRSAEVIWYLYQQALRLLKKKELRQRTLNKALANLTSLEEILHRIQHANTNNMVRAFLILLLLCRLQIFDLQASSLLRSCTTLLSDSHPPLTPEI